MKQGPMMWRRGQGTGDRGWRCRMETTVGRGMRDDNDNYDQARRGEGKERR